MHYRNPGPAYLHGGEAIQANSQDSSSTKDHMQSKSEWKANEDGSIPCPPKDMQGCDGGLLELRCIISENEVSELVKKAEDISELIGVTRTPAQHCSCFSAGDGVDLSGNKLRKAASREISDDNYLYCPRIQDIQHQDLKHFQWHWNRGQPVIVSNVLECTSGLSWEPLVMWRACRQMQHAKHGKHLEVKAMDCLDWCEVSSSKLLFCQLISH